MSKGDASVFTRGMRDGIPIGLGYFAVAFSLGIIARDCGFSPFQGFFASITTYASAGQYIGFTLYGAGATLMQLIIMTVITNARYVLMGFALNQRLPEGTPMRRRLLAGVAITDEIFGITIARPGYINPWYPFGALVTASPMWAIGTALGISMGNILPANIVSALSVALFGMFLAVITPASKRDKIVGLVVAFSFAASYGIRFIPLVNELSTGNKTIILTLVISAAAALVFPKKDLDQGNSAPEDLDPADPAAEDPDQADPSPEEEVSHV